MSDVARDFAAGLGIHAGKRPDYDLRELRIQYSEADSDPGGWAPDAG